MNLSMSKEVAVNHELPSFAGGVEGLMCEREDRYRIGNYLTEQGYEKEWEIQQRRYERVSVLKNVWVIEDEKGKGKGNELVQWFLDEALERDMEAVFLVADTLQGNEFDLVEWYASFGFLVVANNDGGCPLMCWAQEDVD